MSPTEVVARGCIQFTQTVLVCSEVDERVAVGPVGSPPLLGRLSGELHSHGLGLALVSHLWVEDHQTRFVRIRDIGVVLWADVDASEVAACLCLTLEPFDDLCPDVFPVEALRLVLREIGSASCRERVCHYG